MSEKPLIDIEGKIRNFFKQISKPLETTPSKPLETTPATNPTTNPAVKPSEILQLGMSEYNPPMRPYPIEAKEEVTSHGEPPQLGMRG